MSDPIKVGNTVQWPQFMAYKRGKVTLTGTVREVHRLVFHAYAIVEAGDASYLVGLDELTRVEPVKVVS